MLPTAQYQHSVSSLLPLLTPPYGLCWDPSVGSCSIYLTNNLLMLYGKIGSSPVYSLKITLATHWVLNDCMKKLNFCELNLMTTKGKKKGIQNTASYMLIVISIANSPWIKIIKLVDSFRAPLSIKKCKKMCVCAFFCIPFSKLLIVLVCVNKAFTFVIIFLLFLSSLVALFFSYCFSPLLVAVITQWDFPEKSQENQNEKISIFFTFS